MTAVILTIHSLIVLALIGVVLLQRSDGGALGLGGGGGGGFMTGRGAANALTRTTSILAAAFFATSLLLAVRAGGGDSADDVINELTGTEPAAANRAVNDGELTADELLNSLGAGSETEAASPEELLQQQGVDAPAAAQTETPAEDSGAQPAEDGEEPAPESPNQ